jgi:hypothetical protein
MRLMNDTQSRVISSSLVQLCLYLFINAALFMLGHLVFC